MTRVSMNPWNPVYSTHDMIRRNVPISESIRVVVETILTKGIDSWQEWSLQTSEEDGCSFQWCSSVEVHCQVMAHSINTVAVLLDRFNNCHPRSIQGEKSPT